MKILVCGGAGYIGSHLVREIVRETKHQVVVLDALQCSHKASAVEKGVVVEVGDVRDGAVLDRVFTTHQPDAVVHMCASIIVPDSVRDPLSYYDNNVIGIIRILQAMQRHKCPFVVFSSTAALFGTPSFILNAPPGTPLEKLLLQADTPCAPESPYGDTKLIAEWLLKSCDAAYGIRSVCLRYFNACGAHKDGDIGECHEPESHLIPLVLQVPQGKRKEISIFGTDYSTPDGTCVRDYIHVTDLATAHIAALEYLQSGGKTEYFNLGSGIGYSVRQIIEAARRVTGHEIPAKECPRREGDPPILVTSSQKAQDVLGWKLQYTNIDDIIASAWKFHESHPQGLSSSL